MMIMMIMIIIIIVILMILMIGGGGGGGGAGRGGLVLLVDHRLCMMQWMIFKVMRPSRIPTNLTTMACMTTSNGCHDAEMTRWWCYLWRQVNLREPNGEDLWLFDENHLYHLSLILMMMKIQPPCGETNRLSWYLFGSPVFCGAQLTSRLF